MGSSQLQCIPVHLDLLLVNCELPEVNNISYLLFQSQHTFIEHLLSPWHQVGAQQHHRGVPLLLVDRRKERCGGREDRRVSRQDLGFSNGRRWFVFFLLLHWFQFVRLYKSLILAEWWGGKSLGLK